MTHKRERRQVHEPTLVDYFQSLELTLAKVCAAVETSQKQSAHTAAYFSLVWAAGDLHEAQELMTAMLQELRPKLSGRSRSR